MADKMQFLDYDGLSEFKNSLNGVDIVTTEGDGAAYTATVPGITELKAGFTITVIPHTTSTNVLPTLNINGLGAKRIRRRVSNSTVTTVAASSEGWLYANKPIRMTYDGTYWIADNPRPNADDLYGTVSIASGGTGATTAEAAREALGVASANYVEEKLAEVAENAAAYTDGKHLDATATITAEWTGDAAPYTQIVTVPGILETDKPHIFPVYSSELETALAQKEAWAMVSKGETAAGTITFTCFEDKPEVEIPIQIEVNR